jgi:hypothetical protein
MSWYVVPRRSRRDEDERRERDEHERLLVLPPKAQRGDEEHDG